MKLLTLGKYKELAGLMWRAEVAGRVPDRGIDLHVLNAVRLMCEACSEGREDAAWHREALSRIDRREHELREDLKAIVGLIGRRREAGEEGKPGNILEGEGRLRGGRRVLKRRGASKRIRASLTSHGPPRRFDARSAGTPVDAGVLRFPEQEATTSSDLCVYCLGPFEVYLDNCPVKDWPNGKGKAIFKFLTTHRSRPIGKEILMDLYWPNAEPHAARNNLNVAVYGLRQAFARISRRSVVLFRSDSYLINPELDLWMDHEAFAGHLAAARALEREGAPALAMDRYRCAEALYRGDFLEEDRYEDWVERLRQSFRDDYLGLLDRLSERSFEQDDYGACLALCNKMLAIDPCHETAHRRAMRCWCRQGVPHLAVRQYHVCRESLARMLQLEPSDDTRDLFEQIRQRQPV
jgi:DNA-binding SARP family transcriptional activator